MHCYCSSVHLRPVTNKSHSVAVGTVVRSWYTKTHITSYQWQSVSARAWRNGLLLDHTGLRQVHFYSAKIIRVRLKALTVMKLKT